MRLGYFWRVWCPRIVVCLVVGGAISPSEQGPNGPAYLVWYRAVKDSKAPGGVRFVPEVIHNRSGVGSGSKVADLNHDGRPDIITAGDKGVYVFLNKSPGKPVKGSTNPGSVSK